MRVPLKLSDGTLLPAGTHFCMASHAILHEAGQLPGGDNPDKFDPFRYARLREDHNHPANASRFQFATTSENSLHFRHGKFACPGQFLASNEIKIILSEMLLQFDFEFPKGQGRPLSLSADENIYPDPSARVLVRTRTYEETVSCNESSRLAFRLQ